MPVNLCVPVPEGVDPRRGLHHVGAIAMQGLRQADMALGEVVRDRPGLIGQALVQLLRANGVRVVGIDISPSGARWPRSRARLRRRPRGPTWQLVAALAELTGGWRRHGVPERRWRHQRPVELAARLARDRGRVVDIGKCSLDLPWNAYYEKELDVRFSRSYGPGRYDPMYEEQGVDYPSASSAGRRGCNLACFVDLLARDQIQLDRLISLSRPSTPPCRPTSSSTRASSRASASCSSTRRTWR